MATSPRRPDGTAERERIQRDVLRAIVEVGTYERDVAEHWRTLVERVVDATEELAEAISTSWLRAIYGRLGPRRGLSPAAPSVSPRRRPGGARP